MDTHTVYFKFEKPVALLEFITEIPTRVVPLYPDGVLYPLRTVQLAVQVYCLTTRWIWKDRLAFDRASLDRQLTYKEVSALYLKPVVDYEEMERLAEQFWRCE